MCAIALIPARNKLFPGPTNVRFHATLELYRLGKLNPPVRRCYPSCRTRHEHTKHPTRFSSSKGIILGRKQSEQQERKTFCLTLSSLSKGKNLRKKTLPANRLEHTSSDLFWNEGSSLHCKKSLRLSFSLFLSSYDNNRNHSPLR